MVDIERLRGTSASDTMIGSDTANLREETFQSFAGNDIVDGRSGYDIIDYGRDTFLGATSGIAVNLSTAAVNAGAFGTIQAGTGRDGFGFTDSLYYIEGVRGTDLNDFMLGSAGNNQFRSNGGVDTIDGGLGIDGVEMFIDWIFTGPGAIVNLAAGSFTFNAITVGSNQARGVDGATSLLSSIEQVTGSVADDAINGSENKDYL